MKRDRKTVTIVLYIVWAAIFIMRIATWTFWQIGIWLIMALLALIIKDILLYTVHLQPMKTITHDTDKARQEPKNKLHYYLLANRVYIFPLVLVIYLIYLLIKQTHVWNLHNNIFYQIIDENVFLALVIISWILTVFQEEADKKYQHIETSLWSTYKYIALTIVLSLLWTYIIYTQTIQIGWIGYLISGIAGLLIFLIGVMVIEDTWFHINHYS